MEMWRYKCPTHNCWTKKQKNTDQRYCALCKKLVDPKKPN